jgi:cation diffusion facilitator family transporter
MSTQGNSLRAILFALGANFAIFVAKLTAASVTASGAMLAEAVHSLADCGNQVLLLYGMRHAKRPPTPDFPLGQGKAIYFWSFLVALLLFGVGGGFSMHEGLAKLAHPEPLKWPWLAILVLGFSLVVEWFSMAACLREVNRARGSQSLFRWFRTSRQTELIVIFGEDLAALIGLALALLAVLATTFSGDPTWDALGSISIGLLLAVVALFVANQIKSMLIGRSIDPAMRKALEQFLTERPEITRVLNLITIQLGPDIAVAVKAEMREQVAARVLLDEVNQVEAELRQRFPEVRWCFFEPDVTD